MLVKDIIKRAMIMAGNPDPAVVSVDDAVEFVNQGIEYLYSNSRIGLRTDEFEAQNLTVNKTISTTNNVFVYVGNYYIITDIDEVNAVRIANVYYGGKELLYIPYERYLKEKDLGHVTTPTFWTIKNNQILFYTSIDDTVEIRYYSTPPAVYSYDDDINVVGPNIFFNALELFVAKEISRLIGDLNKYAGLEALLEKKIQELNRVVNT